MEIGKKKPKALAKELADGWKGFLSTGQRAVLAQEVQDIIEAVIARQNG